MTVPTDFIVSLLLWFVRAFISSIICLIIGVVAIKAISSITTKISEFKILKGDPIGTGLFVTRLNPSSFFRYWQ